MTTVTIKEENKNWVERLENVDMMIVDTDHITVILKDGLSRQFLTTDRKLFLEFSEGK